MIEIIIVVAAEALERTENINMMLGEAAKGNQVEITLILVVPAILLEKELQKDGDLNYLTVFTMPFIPKIID